MMMMMMMMLVMAHPRCYLCPARPRPFGVF
jgi:hypothetical protein